MSEYIYIYRARLNKRYANPLPLRNGHIYMNDVQYAETNQKKFPIYNF